MPGVTTHVQNKAEPQITFMVAEINKWDDNDSQMFCKMQIWSEDEQ